MNEFIKEEYKLVPLIFEKHIILYYFWVSCYFGYKIEATSACSFDKSHKVLALALINF